jgi:hypothetical protein
MYRKEEEEEEEKGSLESFMSMGHL